MRYNDQQRRLVPAPNHPQRIAIIGAGITGVMTAWHLACDGHEVTLIEKKIPAHGGATSRSAACVRQQFGVEANIIATRFSVDFYERFAAIMDASPVLTQNGYLYPYSDSKSLDRAKSAVDLQRRLGLSEVELFDNPTDIIKRFPELSVEGLLGGTFCRSDGFIRPTEAVADTVKCLTNLGVTIFNWTEVVGAEFNSDGTIASLLVQNSVGQAGSITCDVVINCSNVWSTQLGVNLGTSLFDRAFSVEIERNGTVEHVDMPLIRPWKRYLNFVHVKNGLSDQEFRSRPMYVFQSGAYGHPDQGRDFMLGWAQKPDRPLGPKFADDEQDVVDPGYSYREGVHSYAYAMWTEAAKHLPFLASEGNGLRATTCGLYDRSPDDCQIIDYDLEVPNLLHAVGFSGHGVMVAPFSGEALRQLVVGGRELRDLTLDVRDQVMVIDRDKFAINRKYVADPSAI